MATVQPEGAAPAPDSSESATGPHPTTTMPMPTAAAETTATPKPIHSLVVDTGPLIKNEVAISTLLAQAEVIYTIPAVISEIRDEATRSRLQTSLVPFLQLRNPRPESIKFVSEFARKTGDLQVLSRPDLHLIALTYELECERNHGDWRLRREPGQKAVNGKPPAKEGVESTVEKAEGDNTDPSAPQVEGDKVAAEAETAVAGGPEIADGDDPAPSAPSAPSDTPKHADEEIEEIQSQVQDLVLEISPAENDAAVAEDAATPEVAEDDDSDSDGWITPSNIKKHQAREGLAPAGREPAVQKTLQACLLTSDFAMQNVSLRMNLNCAGSGGGTGAALRRITHLKTWVLRCHGCFTVTRQQDKQFCPKCGQPTLTRTSCSTRADGTVQLHLRRNFQYNKRGNVYSIPKPVHGSASGKNSAVTGGGRSGWGKELLLAEDQKEYTKRVQEDSRTKYRDLMDEDYLPNLLSGHRSGGNGRLRVGAGRDVNAKKRR